MKVGDVYVKGKSTRRIIWVEDTKGGTPYRKVQYRTKSGRIYGGWEHWFYAIGWKKLPEAGADERG